MNSDFQIVSANYMNSANYKNKILQKKKHVFAEGLKSERILVCYTSLWTKKISKIVTTFS